MSNQLFSMKMSLIFFLCPVVALCYITPSVCIVILFLPPEKKKKTPEDCVG